MATQRIYLIDHVGWLRHGQPTDDMPEDPIGSGHEFLCEEDVWETREGAEAARAKLEAVVDADGFGRKFEVEETEAHGDFIDALDLLNDVPAFRDTPPEWSIGHRAAHAKDASKQGREKAMVNAAMKLLP